jgi:hypothetical protein
VKDQNHKVAVLAGESEYRVQKGDEDLQAMWRLHPFRAAEERVISSIGRCWPSTVYSLADKSNEAELAITDTAFWTGGISDGRTYWLYVPCNKAREFALSDDHSPRIAYASTLLKVGNAAADGVLWLPPSHAAASLQTCECQYVGSWPPFSNKRRYMLLLLGPLKQPINGPLLRE